MTRLIINLVLYFMLCGNTSTPQAQSLTLSTEDRELLETLVRAKTTRATLINRACILLIEADGESTDMIVDTVGLNRNSELLCVKNIGREALQIPYMMLTGRGVLRKSQMMQKPGSGILPAKNLPDFGMPQNCGSIHG